MYYNNKQQKIGAKCNLEEAFLLGKNRSNNSAAFHPFGLKFFLLSKKRGMTGGGVALF